MTIQSNSLLSAERPLWYRQPEAVNRWFNGVFEGGGAKGIAFAGALKALRRRHCWFISVAGSSAGSITAALIASGLEPEEIEAMVEKALKTVRLPRWAAKRTLRAGIGYYSKEGLKKWIKNTIKNQISALGATSEDPNFKELFDLTGIELNVIATSLSLKSLVVFSYHDTPNCSVADAVAASAAIPFAFGDSLLEIKDTDGTIWHQTIVDGGVWANFPWFVYTDHNFRKLYERTEEISQDSIIGFILDESRSFQNDDDQYREGKASKILRGSHIKFSDAVKENPWEKRSLRISRHEKSNSETQPWLHFHVFRLLARLISKLGEVASGARAEELSPDRWPEPSSSFHKHLVESISGVFHGLTGEFSVIATLFVVISMLYMFGSITVFAFPWWWSTLPFSFWGVFVKFFLLVLWGTFFLSILLFAEAVFLLFMTARFLDQPLRRIGYGLVTTYVAGSGAPEWTCTDPRIVSLPVAGVGTTDFDLAPDAMIELIGRAEKETDLRLTSLGVHLQEYRTL